jgi:signal transduction histidine kinase
MRSFLGVPIMIAGEAFGNLYLTEKRDADEFSEEDQEAVELLAAFAALAIDHAQRYTVSEANRIGLERTVTALDATLQIARALAGETDLDSVLELVAKRGRALVAARALVIEHLRGGLLVVAAAAGEIPGEIVGRELALEDSVASAALRTATTQRLEDEPNRRRFERHGLGRLGFHVSAGLVVPLMFRGRPHGALVAVDRLDSGPIFSDNDRALLEAFAASAAAAVATAESVAQDRAGQRVAASEEERGRWARELHDETLQGLASLRMRLAAARRLGTHEAIENATSDVLDQIDQEIANLRSLITELRPAALDELGAGAALDALVERARERGLDVEAEIDMAWERGGDESRLTTELETAVYRVTQEALTNVEKHGDASHAWVTVRDDAEHVTIVVRDDGRGFDPSAATAGFGLLGMRERAELLNGKVEVRSAPGEGAEVRVDLPVQRRAPQVPRADVA